MKNTLDEARILMLGSQVLLGFQYRSFFEKGYDKLPWGDRACELSALFALLVTLGALFVPVARHRLIEQGKDSERFHHFAMMVIRLALAPFLVAITLDLAVAGNRILGPSGGAATGALTATAGGAFLYGHFFNRHRKPRTKPEDGMEKTDLAMVLTEPFEKLPEAAKLVHLASLGCIALATIVLMAPAAYHRIVENGEDSERFHRFASRMVLLALALLAPGFSGEVYVVMERAGLPRAAWVCAALLLLSFYAAWFGAMLLLRKRILLHLQEKTA